MEIAPCPHCYRKTIPMADGTCPACGGNSKDASGMDSNLVLVGIYSGQRMPAICHNCGVPTRATTPVAAQKEPGNASFDPGIGRFFAHLFKPLAFIDQMERNTKTVELYFDIPTCERCARALQEIAPRYIDFEAHRIDLVVHREFERAMESL